MSAWLIALGLVAIGAALGLVVGHLRGHTAGFIAGQAQALEQMEEPASLGIEGGALPPHGVPFGRYLDSTRRMPRGRA